MNSGDREILVETQELKVYYSADGGLLGRNRQTLRAVDGVNLQIKRGELFGLVGESGSGKSSLARAILGLTPLTYGRIVFRGLELTAANLRGARRHMQMIFQDPFSSLNPRMTVSEIVAEPLRIQKVGSRQDQASRVRELMTLVGLSVDSVQRYPHEFSGGQRQRIGIARALSTEPDFIVCDEAVSALDVSIQAQIINLLKNLQERLGLTLLFIAHDLNVVRIVSDQVAVMYLGRVVESGPTAEIFHRAKHPYTHALLKAIPVADPHIAKASPRKPLQGEIPSPVSPPSGCTFRTRCPYATPLCAEREPITQKVSHNHFVNCHYWEDLTF